MSSEPTQTSPNEQLVGTAHFPISPTQFSQEITQFPGYEVGSEIARGGMGVVYRARQVGTNRDVALKTFTPGRTLTDLERARFRAESLAVADLDHPNIVPIYEVGDANGVPYFSMKLIAGQSLKDALADSTWKPSIREKVQLIISIAQAVHHAHLRGIIHRDLKPGNILLDELGVPHVTDFGIAKRTTAETELTRTGALLGTPAYMSPEQASGDGKSITTLTDVYAIGVILYELLTNRRPFEADTPLALIRQVADAPVPSPRMSNESIDRDLEAVCLKCLAKTPVDRYTTANDLAEDLQRWLDGEPVAARSVGLTYTLWRFLRKNIGTATKLIIIGVSCAILMSTSVIFGQIQLLLVRLYPILPFRNWF